MYHTRAQAKSAVIDYIEGFYTSQRLYSILGYRSPIHLGTSSRFLLNKLSFSTHIVTHKFFRLG
ncbi:MAG: hypothetical protein AB2989_03390 [Candidatus Symbiodolus clandestinus]